MMRNRRVTSRREKEFHIPEMELLSLHAIVIKYTLHFRVEWLSSGDINAHHVAIIVFLNERHDGVVGIEA